jgi:hypothetical protein
MLRERISTTMLIMKDDAINIEGNMTSSSEIKDKLDPNHKENNEE